MITKEVASELALRTSSALVLVALSLSLTYANAQTFAGLVLFFAVLMGWEWGRVVRGRSLDFLFYVQTAATLTAGLLALAACKVIAALWVLAATLIVYGLDKFAKASRDPWWSAAGVYYAAFPTMVLIALRQDPEFGFWAVFYLFIVVWCADTGAFFAGRLVGGPRLLPRVSPNKTWAGLLGGSFLAAISGMAFAVWLGQTSIPWLGVQSFLLALMSQVGDLGESAMKRMFGVKHSSGLIPGHGGVLDRLDGFVFAVLGAGIITAGDPLRPGRALLIW